MEVEKLTISEKDAESIMHAGLEELKKNNKTEVIDVVNRLFDIMSIELDELRKSNTKIAIKDFCVSIMLNVILSYANETRNKFVELNSQLDENVKSVSA